MSWAVSVKKDYSPIEQFAALRCFFPSTPLPPGLQLDPPLGSHQDPDNTSLTGGLHKKTLRGARWCTGPAGAIENQQSFHSFPSVRVTSRTWTPPRLTAHSPPACSSDPARSTKITGFWKQFWKKIASGNWPPSQMSHQLFFGICWPWIRCSYCIQILSLCCSSWRTGLLTAV